MPAGYTGIMRHTLYALGLSLLCSSCATRGRGDDRSPAGGGGPSADDDGTGDDGLVPGDDGSGGASDCVGVGCTPGFDLEEDDARGVIETPEGAITLGGDGALGQHIWIANTREGTVSKIDTRARVEVARYVTGPTSLTSPSRTTVAFSGDCVVANRDEIGAAVKFYGAHCPDRDGDGQVETSSGPHDVLGWMQDECMAWSTPIGAVARGAAFEVRSELDDPGHEWVWVGSTTDLVIREIDSVTGELTGRVLVGEEPYYVWPYGIAMGPDHTLWTFGYEATNWGQMTRLFAFDTVDLSVRSWPAPQGFYGIAVDSQGRVWTGGATSRFDPETGEFTRPNPQVGGAGITVDAYGNAYTGEEGQGYRIDGDDMTATAIPVVGGHGWAVDFDGFLWSIPYEGAVAHVSDPETLQPIATVEGLVGAYTYSDMTGFQLANATDPVGTYAHVFEGCGEGVTTWIAASWEASVPAGSSVTFAVRTADDAGALAVAPVVTLGTAPPDEAPLSIEDALAAAGVPHGQLLRLQVTLESRDLENAPVVRSLSVTKDCEEVLQ